MTDRLEQHHLGPHALQPLSPSDPWTVPGSAGSALASGADRPPTADPAVPAWILQIARRYPPAHVTAEEFAAGWHNTVVHTRLAIGACAGTSLAVLVDVSTGWLALGTLLLLFAIGCLTRLLVRRFATKPRSWCGYAIAYAGAHDELGYTEFARLPGIERFDAAIRRARLLPLACLLPPIVLDLVPHLPSAVRLGFWALPMASVAAVPIAALTLQRGARRAFLKAIRTIS
jgi:hypothetical protein